MLKSNVLNNSSLGPLSLHSERLAFLGGLVRQTQPETVVETEVAAASVKSRLNVYLGWVKPIEKAYKHTNEANAATAQRDLKTQNHITYSASQKACRKFYGCWFHSIAIRHSQLHRAYNVRMKGNLQKQRASTKIKFLTALYCTNGVCITGFRTLWAHEWFSSCTSFSITIQTWMMIFQGFLIFEQYKFCVSAELF